MIWEDAYPQDNLPANTIHSILQNTKVQIRERLESFDGEHSHHTDFDSNLAGRHLPSVTGFCGKITSWSERPLINLVDGSLWFVDTEDTYRGIYYIKNQEYVRIAPTDHSQLNFVEFDEGSQILNPHTIYTLSSAAMPDDVHIENLSVTVSDPETSDLLLSDHVTKKWSEAHPDTLITQRMVSLGNQISKNKLILASHTANGLLELPGPPEGSKYFMFFPLTRNASNTTTYLECNIASVKASSTDFKVYYIEGAFEP